MIDFSAYWNKTGQFLKNLFGSQNERVVKSLWPRVHQVNELESWARDLSEEAVKERVAEWREKVQSGEATLDDALPEMFAMTREAARRTLGMRHFDVQIMGGIVLHQGKIAEMVTGEGKTLVATLAASLNALDGKGVYIVTVNDYLAKRDRDWMAPVYEYLGLTVGAIQSDMDPWQRHPEYACDITYGTNNEFGFDYLRDNMKLRVEEQVQKHLHYAIIDEVDSILIDEARTPLIISGPPEGKTEKYLLADRIARRLKPGVHFEIKEKEQLCLLTDEGIEYAERLAGVDSFYSGKNMDWPHHIEQALRAHNIYKRDHHYVVKDDEIIIVDEFTGRLMHGRRWSDGLHQAVEAKEGIRPREENQTLATITFQNYFRLFDKIAGMTGTAMTEAAEFAKIYNLDVVSIPTNRPLIRRDHDDNIYLTEKDKFKAIVEEIDRIHGMGRPILVGTTSIEKSERLSAALSRRGLQHEVLNAKHHEREAKIVAQAGQYGAITVATNMAGRGTDIKLGEGVVKKSCIHPETGETWCCIGCDRPERADNCARCWKKQADPENWRGGKFRKCVLGNKAPCECGSGKPYIKCCYPKYGEWDDPPCGLHIIGTERHEARRIDNQLRGRAGRQGDPGSTRFFLSFDDDLMRIFARDWVKTVMEKLGLKEGEVIRSPMVSRGIERAQKKVEARNFEIRKNLLEYDEVMDKQRKFIYRERQEVLEGRETRDKVWEMIEKVVSQAVEGFMPERGEPDMEGLKAWLAHKFGPDFDLSGLEAHKGEALLEEILSRAEALYERREKENGPEAMRTIERYLLLDTIDRKWKDHLWAMDALKAGIGLRGYAQVDPKTEFKKEGYEKFQRLLESVADEVTDLIFKVQLEPVPETGPAPSEEEPLGEPAASQAPGVGSPPPLPAGNEAVPETATRKKKKVGRNDPCPCGSGKKYKKCCGRNKKD